MLLYVYRLSPASTSVQMSCSVSRSDIIVKSWEFRRNHKPPCSVYIRCRGVNGYLVSLRSVVLSLLHVFPSVSRVDFFVLRRLRRPGHGPQTALAHNGSLIRISLLRGLDPQEMEDKR